MAGTLTVNLTITAAPSAPRISLSIPKDVTPAALRKLVSEATKIPLDKLRLIFRGRLIGNDGTKNAVEEFKLEEGTVLHCMGKPEGATAAVAPPAAAIASTAGSSISSTTIPQTNAAPAPSSSNPLQAAFATMRSGNPPLTYVTAVTTLEKILTNIIANPMEEKYRSVKKQNAAFQKRLGGVTGGDAAMKAAGFIIDTKDGEEVYLMQASAEKWPELVAAKTAVEAAVREAKAAASAPPPAVGGMPNFGGMPGMDGMGGMSGMGGMGGMPGMGPDMQAAAQRMMQDPAMLQNMLQNPMVQNMIRNDPRFANNPMMRQMLENPAVLQQVSHMMRDPQMQQQMQQMQAMMQDPQMRSQVQSMMAGLGAGAGMPPFGAGAVNANAGGGQQGTASPPGGSGGNDEQQTEEEMIAEAIRRSLEEGS